MKSDRHELNARAVGHLPAGPTKPRPADNYYNPRR
jgi:hypothetical protein